MKGVSSVAAASVLAALPLFAREQVVSAWRGETVVERLQDFARLEGEPPEGVALRRGAIRDVNYRESREALRWQQTTYDLHKTPEIDRTLKPFHLETVADRVEWNGFVTGSPRVVEFAVSSAAKPGLYDLGDVKLRVLDRVLPPAKEWKTFLDLWQHPWAVARVKGVKPFSKEHYAAMEPLWRMLAEAGGKTLTVSLVHEPWNHQCYDAYEPMVKVVRDADGRWSFDYALFDEYVEFGRRCGLGPRTACYTMCPWDYRVSWLDADGKLHRRAAKPGTPFFDEYWGAYLPSLAQHLKEKGWFDDALISMDERSREDVKYVGEFIEKCAPGLRVSMAGAGLPSEMEGINIDVYSQSLHHMTPKFLAEAATRHAEGKTTTFYVCCWPPRPNTFMSSGAGEAFWLGFAPTALGLDGFLRWAYNSWGEDPMHDMSYDAWLAGDTALVYPDGSPSWRFVELRRGIVAAEKVRILREAGEVPSDLDAALKEFDPGKAMRGETQFFILEERMLKALASVPDLRVGSYNIRFSDGDRGTPNDWNLRKEALAGQLRGLDLDVFGLQEVCPDQMADLRERLPDYELVGDHRDQGRQTGEASPVVYRKDRFECVKSGTFWLSETPEVPGSKSWDTACPRVCSYVFLKDRQADRRICFANTHLDHWSAAARENGMKLILERLSGLSEGAPVVLTGDHNCRHGDAPAITARTVLCDARDVAESPDPGPRNTFHAFGKLAGDPRNLRIDFIYASSGTRVLDFVTHGDRRPGSDLYPSDHYPVSATLVLSNPTVQPGPLRRNANGSRVEKVR